jgi:hypothetical protein
LVNEVLRESGCAALATNSKNFYQSGGASGWSDVEQALQQPPGEDFWFASNR